ncbi:unnamed protein product [Diatraea saccharalis]|uniref:Uncharacterized protein n=1 Tax=Diatraea saccharalis TaxID=40085 RepID=A0A9P0G3L9_9NEOP|nr:unnamed protein product [Diatraea saccharalis]
MESPKIIYKYYSNPAFCAQSEVFQKQCITKVLTPDRKRMPPLGANSPRKMDLANRILRTDISDNPLRMSPAGRLRDEPPELPPKPAKFMNRSFQRQSSLVYKTSRTSIRSRTRSEDLEMAQFKQQRRSKYERNAESDDGLEDSRLKHRYEVIRDDYDDLMDYSPTKKRIIEAKAEDVEEYNVDGPDDNEMKEIPAEIVKTVNGRTLRYAIVPSDDEEPVKKGNVTFTSPVMSRKNLIATQKLHELLSTPRKLKSYASQPSVHVTPNKSMDSPHRYVTPKKMVSSTPTQGVTPSKSCANLTMSRGSITTSPISPKAQQKLNYGIPELEQQDVFVTSFREKSRDRSLDMSRRETSRESRRDYERRGKDQKDKTTAVIMPRVAPPPEPSEYSETTYKSFTTLKPSNAAPLTIAALMLTLCGALTTGLSFNMMYTVSILRSFYHLPFFFNVEEMH